MAYISTEKTAMIREELKICFPAREGWKLSVSQRDHSVLTVCILKAPMKFWKPGVETGNGYNVNLNCYGSSDVYTQKAHKVLETMFQIINKGNYDNSRAEVDYFDVGYYAYIKIGDWNKQFEVSKPKGKVCSKKVVNSKNS